MHKCLENYNLPRLNHEERESLNRFITNKKIETIIKNLPTKKSPGPDVFTNELQQTFKKEIMPILIKLFQKTEKEATTANSFYEVSVTLI